MFPKQDALDGWALDELILEDPLMAYPMEEFIREARQQFLQELTPEERLAVLNPLSPEERRRGLKPEERRRGLEPEELRQRNINRRAGQRTAGGKA